MNSCRRLARTASSALATRGFFAGGAFFFAGAVCCVGRCRAANAGSEAPSPNSRSHTDPSPSSMSYMFWRLTANPPTITVVGLSIRRPRPSCPAAARADDAESPVADP